MLTQRIYDVFRLMHTRIFTYAHPEIHEAEIEFTSPAGDEFTLFVYHDGTPEDFILKFTSAAEAFDPDEYAADKIPMRGKNGTPNSIRAIIQDAEAIQNRLLSIAAKIRNPEEEYTVELNVYGTISVKVTAKSFEEAHLLAKNKAAERITEILDHFNVNSHCAEDPRGYRHYTE